MSVKKVKGGWKVVSNVTGKPLKKVYKTWIEAHTAEIWGGKL